ncbi:hypothetical protein OS493_038177, partial [Desmophyllum pertusum]
LTEHMAFFQRANTFSTSLGKGANVSVGGCNTSCIAFLILAYPIIPLSVQSVTKCCSIGGYRSGG